jgi:hypothetical protein
MVGKDELDCKTAATSCQTQLTMSSFTLSLSPTKVSFKKAFSLVDCQVKHAACSLQQGNHQRLSE